MALKRIALACAMATASFAQGPGDVVYRQAYQGTTGSWTAIGEGASVAAPAEAGRLEFHYQVGAKIFCGLVSPAPADFAKMQRIRVRVKTDHATAMGVLLSEKKPGGNYSAWFWSPANTWQTVELTPADFTVNDGAKDPKDPDGKLDLGDVEAIGLFDLAQFFGQWAANPNMPVSVAAAPGAHTAMMESFEVLSTAPEGERNLIRWISPGPMEMTRKPGETPLKGSAIEARYQETEGEIQLLVRRVAAEETAGAKRIVFDIASEQEATLVLSVEESNPEGGQGARFTLPIYPPGGKEVFHVDVSLSDFQGQGKFDPSKWRSMAIADVTAATGGGGANTLWLSDVEMRKE